MEFITFFWNSLRFTTVHVCGSKFSRWVRTRVRSDSDMPFAITIILGPVTAILCYIVGAIYKHNSPLQIAVVVGWYMFLLLVSYDLDAVQCMLYKKSEFYRATGHTMKDIVRDKGIAGEFSAYVLSKKLDFPHRTLYNVCVPMINGNFQEVDAIIISQNNLYVLECKNRSGNFNGYYTSQMWKQRIGDQEHEVPNIYLQNQEHIAALEYYLKSKGIMSEFCVCCNILLHGGNMSLNIIGNESNFYWGDIDSVKKYITEVHAGIMAREDESFMDNAYLALLPYTFYDRRERKQMLEARQARIKEFAKGEYRYYKFDDTTVGEEYLLRKNRIYTQMMMPLEDDNGFIYMTMPGLDYQEENVMDDDQNASARHEPQFHYDAFSGFILDDSEPEEEEPFMDEDMLIDTRFSQEIRKIQEGDVQRIKSVPLTRYWEDQKQIAKFKCNITDQKYLQTNDGLNLTMKRNAKIIFIVSAVIVFLLVVF